MVSSHFLSSTICAIDLRWILGYILVAVGAITAGS